MTSQLTTLTAIPISTGVHYVLTRPVRRFGRVLASAGELVTWVGQPILDRPLVLLESGRTVRVSSFALAGYTSPL